MKYKKCPRCGLNYILIDEEICKVCKDELEHKPSLFDADTEEEWLCPFCYRNKIGFDEVMCAQCLAKRCKTKEE